MLNRWLVKYKRRERSLTVSAVALFIAVFPWGGGGDFIDFNCFVNTEPMFDLSFRAIKTKDVFIDQRYRKSS